MKKKPYIAFNIHQLAMLQCNPCLAITDFNFADNKVANRRIFEKAFTMCNDAEMIALELACMGYNDNLN